MEIFAAYFQKKHFLLNVDARMKLITTAALLAMVLSCKGIFFPLLVAFSCVLLGLKMHIPFRILFLRYAEPLFIAGTVLVLKFLFSGTEVCFSAKIIGIRVAGYKDGLFEGLKIASRIIGASSLFIIFSFATSFNQLFLALSWVRVPRGLIEILAFAYRYVFMLFEDALVIYNTQKNRLGYVGIKSGLRCFGMLLGELVLRAFTQSQKTTLAMVQRGYSGELPLGCAVSFKAKEVMLTAGVICAMGWLWWQIR